MSPKKGWRTRCEIHWSGKYKHVDKIKVVVRRERGGQVAKYGLGVINNPNLGSVWFESFGGEWRGGKERFLI